MSKGILITELIWLTTILKVFGQSYLANCTMNNKKTDCSYRGDLRSRRTVSGVQLPSGVNHGQVTELDVSNNFFSNITFDKFLQVKVLHMRNLDFENPNKFPMKRWFFKLKVLEEIDMSETNFGDQILDIIWPAELSKLIASNMKYQLTQVYGLNTLISLEELDLSKNHLKSLPKLNVSAPMKVINLNDNPIVNLTVEEIAPYCELHSFTMQIRGGDALTSIDEFVLSASQKYDSCIQVDEWFARNFPKLHTGLSCLVPPHRARAPKNVTFSEKANKLRNECLARSPSTTVFDLLLYAVFFAILFPILYFGNEAYNKYQSKKTAVPSTPVKHHRRHTTTTSSPEVGVESAQSEDEYDPDADADADVNPDSEANSDPDPEPDPEPEHEPEENEV